MGSKTESSYLQFLSHCILGRMKFSERKVIILSLTLAEHALI